MSMIVAMFLFQGAQGGAAAGDLAALPPPERYEYAIVRNGDQIGVQTLEFSRFGDDELIVRIHADVALTFLGIPVYRYAHDAEEHWRAGWLVSFKSRTDSNGKPRRVDLKRVGDILIGTYNNDPRELPGDFIPASLWNPATIHQTVLLDPVKGVGRRVRVVDRGEENVATKNGTVAAHHFSITGELAREVWYGPNGRVVQVQVVPDDGSTLTFLLK
jgi:hypothetical protein